MRLRLLLLLSALLLPSTSLSASNSGAPPADAVVVIGALHELHAREPGFGYEQLESIITAFKPDILLLEVRPDELATRGPTPGRPEYPTVIWSLLRKLSVRAIAMEPGGETFQTLASGAGAAFDAFRKQSPQSASTMTQLDTATTASLLAYWQNPAQAQDETTAAMVRGTQAMQFGLVGPSFEKVQTRWDAYMAACAREAVAANPGKRVLVLGSYRNRAILEEEVKSAAPERLLSAYAWVSAQGLKGEQLPRR